MSSLLTEVVYGRIWADKMRGHPGTSGILEKPVSPASQSS